MGFTDSYLHWRWEQQTVKPPSNDFVIAITASGKSTMSRTGKTTLETFLAEETDRTEEGFVAEKKATLDAGELAYDIVPDVENHSTVCLEEAQGAAGTKGLDSRRGMQDESIDAINAILNNGNKELTIIITAQHMPMLDKRLPPLVDAWLLIRHGPSSPSGPLAIHHGMEVEDYNFSSPQIRTPGYEDFAWPKVPESNPNYQVLEEKKRKAKRRDNGTENEDEELPKEVQARVAQQFRDMGKSLKWIADEVDDITYSSEWIRQNTVANTTEQTA